MRSATPCSRAPMTGRDERACATASKQRVERLLERFYQVVGVLEPTRDAHEAVRDPHLQAVLGEHVRMRHDGWAGANRLDGPEVLAQAPRPLHRVHQLPPRLRAALDLEPQ